MYQAVLKATACVKCLPAFEQLTALFVASQDSLLCMAAFTLHEHLCCGSWCCKHVHNPVAIHTTF